MFSKVPADKVSDDRRYKEDRWRKHSADIMASMTKRQKFIIDNLKQNVAVLSTVADEERGLRRDKHYSDKALKLDTDLLQAFDSIMCGIQLKVQSGTINHTEYEKRMTELSTTKSRVTKLFETNNNSAFLKEASIAVYTTISYIECRLFEAKDEIRTLLSPWCRTFTPYQKREDAQKRIEELDQNIGRYDASLEFLRQFYMSIVSSDAIDIDVTGTEIFNKPIHFNLSIF